MKKKASVLIVFFLIIFSGCYDVSAPVDTLENAVADAAVLGKWEKLASASSRPADMKVGQLNDKEYAIEYQDADFAEYSLRGYISSIEGRHYVNVKDYEGTRAKYTIFSYSLEKGSEPAGDILTVRLMNKNHPDFIDSSSLQNFLRENNEKPEALFDTEMKFRRK